MTTPPRPCISCTGGRARPARRAWRARSRLPHDLGVFFRLRPPSCGSAQRCGSVRGALRASPAVARPARGGASGMARKGRTTSWESVGNGAPMWRSSLLCLERAVGRASRLPASHHGRTLGLFASAFGPRSLFFSPRRALTFHARPFLPVSEMRNSPHSPQRTPRGFRNHHSSIKYLINTMYMYATSTSAHTSRSSSVCLIVVDERWGGVAPSVTREPPEGY